MRWYFLDFSALQLMQLYDVLRLRSAVFVVEQACVFHDIDGQDPQAMHLLGYDAGSLVAYARCFGPEMKFAPVVLQRVLVHPAWRGTGQGHGLVRQALHHVQGQWGSQPVRISAQTHLQKFYQQHGFEPMGPPYLEDGIAHIGMLRPAMDDAIAHPRKKS